MGTDSQSITVTDTVTFLSCRLLEIFKKGLCHRQKSHFETWPDMAWGFDVQFHNEQLTTDRKDRQTWLAQ